MNDEPIQILLVDDDEDDFIMTRDLFAEVEGRTYQLDWASNYEEAKEKIKHARHDVCLFDFRLGEKTGLDLLHEVIAEGCTAPIILLTGQGDKEVDFEAMNAGAADFLNKGEISACILERAVRYAIRHKQAEDSIRQMAYYDPLTGLPNRMLLSDRLQQTLTHSERYRSHSALLFLDLDNFKRINDTFEHRAGDILLQEVAGRLSRYIRSSDIVSRHSASPVSNTVARLGGDEFIILLTNIESLESAARVAQRILKIISQPFQLEGHEVFVTGSIGIAIYPFDGGNMDSLMKNADTAMYHAKARGKNNFQFYKQSMNATAFERLTLENELRKAAETGEFELYYQPRIDIRTGRIVAFEALIRWRHPERGIISPMDFIPLAEETGLIMPIGDWVLKTACEQWKIIRGCNFYTGPLALSINISGRQFRQEELASVIEKVIGDSDADPRDIELEITESEIMQDAYTTISTFRKLKDMGLKLSMDDFGTGYSSFNYLKRFPLDMIKIDRTFINGITSTAEDAAIVRAIIAMAHSLKLRVVAEGVETEQQFDFLRELGCDEMQGYLLSPPVLFSEITESADFQKKLTSSCPLITK